MPACTGLICKDGRYHFQARIPAECIDAWRTETGKKGPFHRVNLKTSDPKEARIVVRSKMWPEFEARSSIRWCAT